VLGAGTLYGAINTLVQKQWIRAASEDKDSRKKEYVITDLGKEVLHFEMARLEELLVIGKGELEDAPGGELEDAPEGAPGGALESELEGDLGG